MWNIASVRYHFEKDLIWTFYKDVFIVIYFCAMLLPDSACHLHGHRQEDALDALASTIFSNKKTLHKNMVLWPGSPNFWPQIMPNGHSKCRSLRTILPTSSLQSRSIYCSSADLLTDGHYSYDRDRIRLRHVLCGMRRNLPQFELSVRPFLGTWRRPSSSLLWTIVSDTNKWLKNEIKLTVQTSTLESHKSQLARHSMSQCSILLVVTITQTI